MGPFTGMERTRRTLATLLCAACSLLAAPALAAAHVLVGIADNNTELFSDPRFLALGITTVRDDVPWNVLSNRRGRAALASWLGAAHADGLQPLITFDHEIGSVRTQRELPSVAQFSKDFREFRGRYPWVKDFETWDEANFYLEGTSTDPARAAQYYKVLRSDCPQCTILAPDLLDVPKSEGVPLASWAHAFIADARLQPPLWGLNNYVGANRLETGTTRALLAAVRGNVWFTETGGIVSRHNGSQVGFTQNPKHAATVDRFILTKLAAISPRIKRVYLYDWSAGAPHMTWDSALISWTGAIRPGYDVLANTLDAWGIKPNCAISRVPPACAHAAPTPPGGATTPPGGATTPPGGAT
jgi:hypothetical protein